jgi:hypothetical protein
LANDRTTAISQWYFEQIGTTKHTSTSYIDRSTEEMQEKVRQMLRKKQFGQFWGEPGEFRNLDNEQMDPSLENYETLVAQNRNQKIDEVVLGKASSHLNYPHSTVQVKARNDILQITSIEEARDKIRFLLADPQYNSVADIYHGEANGTKKLKELKQILLTVQNL